MSIRCPSCGEKSLDLEEYTKRKTSNHRDYAVYICSICEHKEVV
jgi:DNA-directed RNA polymerase subunit RPC12/RpoP